MTFLARLSPSVLRHPFPSCTFNRPAPPPLPHDQQREFEHLQRGATQPQTESLHPDARTPVKPDFEGDINPLTGERGGPKTEPVAKWAKSDHGDWSFKGRVSDF